MNCFLYIISGSSGGLKGDALLTLWLGLAALAIIGLIVILGYYLSKKSLEPGTRLESMELENGGMYVFHFNNGSFYSQGTVPTERSNLSDCLQRDLDVTSPQSHTAVHMTSRHSLTSNLLPQDGGNQKYQQLHKQLHNYQTRTGLKHSHTFPAHHYMCLYGQVTTIVPVSATDCHLL